ncbi:hypothetical protein SDC9_204699 [bioreactor metagenome]|uniref:Uncharacterized protein n=1 Tax=bioreactor metagenome TaxID=1076179 RepID=A0A645IZY2_9ZZZZ
MVTKAGSASDMSLRSMFGMFPIINTPTMNKAPVVAALGMSKNSGAKNKAMMKRTATVREVSPVRPPSLMPDALST